MTAQVYTRRAPGSLMLFGEHAVLHGKLALACAVDQYLSVTLIPREDSIIHIHSAALGSHTQLLSELKISSPFEFVIAAILKFQSQFPSGFELKIAAEFASTLGLGSSAAVTVATLAVISDWLQLPISAISLFKLAKEVILDIQKKGSGADLAASIFGGIVGFQVEPLMIQPLDPVFDLTLVYSGSKTPTSQVISQVMESYQKFPDIFNDIFNAIDSCSQQAVKAIQQQNWKILGELMNIHQGLQESLGVSNEILTELIEQLRNYHHILGAKISGSGLGDCVIGLGQIPINYFPLNTQQQNLGIKQIPVKMSSIGCLSRDESLLTIGRFIM